ncbi:UNVERIFIED_CONTAM: hypothetical protein Slati_1340400, partial [Sesamum latifolium]
GRALETAAKLLNMAPSKTVPQTLYEIWHGKPASYKYLRLWGSSAYVKRLVGDKLDSRSSLCKFVGYPKEIAGYYFNDPSEQKFLSPEMQSSWKRVFLRIADAMKCYLKKQVRHLSRMMQHYLNLWFPLIVFQSSVGQPENHDHLTDPPKGVKHVGCKWVCKRKLGADGEVTVFKARLVAK